MNPVGLWTLHFDWGPSGNYHWTPLYFNFDGTFAYLAGANEGTWTQVDDNIIWRFKRLPDAENNTVYSGNCTRNFMSGLMLSFQEEKGHWFAVKKGTKVYSTKDAETIPYLVNRQPKLKLDPIGKKIAQKQTHREMPPPNISMPNDPNYGTKESAIKGIASIKKNAPMAVVVDQTITAI